MQPVGGLTNDTNKWVITGLNATIGAVVPIDQAGGRASLWKVTVLMPDGVTVTLNVAANAAADKVRVVCLYGFLARSFRVLLKVDLVNAAGASQSASFERGTWTQFG